MSISTALCGFNGTEQRLFEGIFRVSMTRQRRYGLWSEGTDAAPDIYLVKQGKQEGVDRWRTLADRFANRDAPVLEIGDAQTQGWKGLSEQLGKETPFLLKPISATRLLDTLDALVEAHSGQPQGVMFDDDVSMEELNELDRQIQGGVASGPMRGKSALVVDDSASLRLQMDITLAKKYGMRVDFAADGATALRKLQNREYDITFLDVMLPDLDGFEICKRIRRDYQSKAPVVMMTSRDGRRDQLKGVLVQADSYLIKPVSADEIEKTLLRFLA